MTEEQIQAQIEYDTNRWRRDGIGEDLINSRNAANRRYFRDGQSPFAAAARLASKIHGTAPGTAIDAKPVVIDGTATTCKTCNGFDYVLGIDNTLKPCEDCGAASRIAERKAASVGEYSSDNTKAARQTFANFEIPKGMGVRERISLQQCHDAVLKFATTPAGWLIIHGPPGNGKSHLAAAAYNSLRKRANPTIFITVPDMLKSLTDLFTASIANEQDTSYGERLKTFQTVPVLILDDLGAHHDGKGWAQSVLFEILDYRYRKELPTIVTMNIGPDDPRLGERIADRLHDNHKGFAAIYHNQAPTHRRI